MNIRFYGQNSLGIEAGGKHLIVDPFISENPLSKDKIDINDLKADYILLTHAHGDHVLDAEAIAKNTGAKIISNFEVVNHYGEKDIEGHAMNIGGSFEFDFGRLKMVNAIHSSSFPDGSYGGNPCGFILEADGKTLYIAGDTALTMDMKLIPKRYDLDLAILPIGDNFSMVIEDAIIASDFIKCDRILGCHYDTFGFIEIDHEEAIAKFKEKNKELILSPIGDVINV